MGLGSVQAGSAISEGIEPRWTFSRADARWRLCRLPPHLVPNPISPQMVRPKEDLSSSGMVIEINNLAWQLHRPQ